MAPAWSAWMFEMISRRSSSSAHFSSSVTRVVVCTFTRTPDTKPVAIS